MGIYLCDFKLPKDFSKKKKLDLSTAICSTVGDKTDSFSWKVNKDCQRLYLTIEDAVVEALNKRLETGDTPETLKKANVAILSMEFPVSEFNDRPCYFGPTGEARDAEFDPETLSFLVTLQNRNSEHSTIVILAVDEVVVDDKGKITSFKTHPKVNSALG